MARESRKGKKSTGVSIHLKSGEDEKTKEKKRMPKAGKGKGKC